MMRSGLGVALVLVLGAGACGDDESAQGSGGAGASGTTSSGSVTGTGGSSATSTGEGAATASSGGGGPGGTGGGGGGTGGAAGFSLGGTAVGVEGTVTLESGADSVEVTGDGPFEFPARLADGAAFEVSIAGEPGLSRCSIEAGSGTIEGADVANVELRCDRKALFYAHDGVRQQIWITDGTPEGTAQLADLNPTGDVGSRSILEDVFFFGDGRALFPADDGVHGEELWVTDGTAAGTVMVADLHPSQGSAPHLPWPGSDGRVYFDANGGTGVDLWSTDGTAAGTEPRVDFAVGNRRPLFAGAAGDLMVAQVRSGDGDNTYAFHATDGTQAGTTRLTAELFNPNTFPQDGPVSLGELVLFPWETPEEASFEELWVTDGTPEGTERLAAPNGGTDPGANSTIILTVAGGLVWMAVGTTDLGREPWVSDGTPGGTHLLADLAPGAQPSDPLGFFEVGGEVAFTAAPAGNNSQRPIHFSDGTAEGTRVLDDGFTGQRNLFGVAGGLLYFIGGGMLRVTDGTPEGTLGLLAPTGAIIAGRATIGDRFLFWMDDPEAGYELHVSDGTPEGTLRLADVCPGACSSFNGL